MSFTLRDIKGAVVEKRMTAIEMGSFERTGSNIPYEGVDDSTYNKAIDAQASVPLRLNRDKIKEIVAEGHRLYIQDKTGRSNLDYIADALISKATEIIEVVK